MIQAPRAPKREVFLTSLDYRKADGAVCVQVAAGTPTGVLTLTLMAPSDNHPYAK